MSTPTGQAPVTGVFDRAVHGGIDAGELERLGLDPERVLDFSTNVNPFGPTEGVRTAVAAAHLGRYPDRECRRLRVALAAHHHLSVDRIVAGNGASELIYLLAAAFLRAGDRVLVLSPAFGEYERAAQLVGAEVEQCWTTGDMLAAAPGDARAIDAEVRRALGAATFRLVFVANPGSPTGDELPPDLIERWAWEWPTTLFVIDEAYAPYVGDRSSLVGSALSNLLVLRSMTKHVALAGVRLGYATGPEALIEALAARRPPWNVSAAAQAAGIAALADAEEYAAMLERLAGEKAFLVAGLTELGFAPRPSPTPFFLLPVGDAAGLRAKLLGEGILVRDCASFGLPGHVRVSPLDRGANRRLLAAISDTVTQSPSTDTVVRPHLDPWAEIRAATGLLSRLHAGSRDPDRTGSAAFPLVGAALAAVAAVPAALLADSAPLLGAVGVPAILAILTGALHLDGLADTFDALVAPTPERSEAARKDPRIGAAGAVALVLLLVATVAAIPAIPGWALVAATAVAGAASRAVPAIAAVAIRPAGDPGTGFGAWFAAHSGTGGAVAALLGVAVITAVAAGVTVLAAPVGTPAWTPIVAGSGSAVAGLATGLVLAASLNRRFGRLAGDDFGAAIEIAFVVALAVQAVAWGAR